MFAIFVLAGVRVCFYVQSVSLPRSAVFKDLIFKGWNFPKRGTPENQPPEDLGREIGRAADPAPAAQEAAAAGPEAAVPRVQAGRPEDCGANQRRVIC